MGYEYHKTNGIVFKAAIAIGFSFTQSVDVDDEGYTMLHYDRESLEDWLKEHGAQEVCRNEAGINMEGRGHPETGWIQGLSWRIRKPDGNYLEFYTRDMAHVRREMLKQRQKKAVAKAAPDPKTPPRTMGTRKDTI